MEGTGTMPATAWQGGLALAVAVACFLLVVREVLRTVLRKAGWIAAVGVVLVLSGLVSVATAQTALGKVVLTLYQGVAGAAAQVFGGAGTARATSGADARGASGGAGR